MREQRESVVQFCSVVHEANRVASILILVTADPFGLDMDMSTSDQHLFGLTELW